MTPQELTLIIRHQHCISCQYSTKFCQYTFFSLFCDFISLSFNSQTRQLAVKTGTRKNIGDPCEHLSKDHSSTLYPGGHSKAAESPIEQRESILGLLTPRCYPGNRASLIPPTRLRNGAGLNRRFVKEADSLEITNGEK